MRATSTLIAKATGCCRSPGWPSRSRLAAARDPAASAADADAKAEKARLRLEQCLRENGLDIQTSDGGRRTIVRADDAKARAAMQKCRKYQQEAFGSITPEQRQEFRDAFDEVRRLHAPARRRPARSDDRGGGPGAAPRCAAARRAAAPGSTARARRRRPR